MFKIQWITKNGTTGQGNEYMPTELAQAWIKYANKKYPETKHTLKELVASSTIRQRQTLIKKK